MVKRALVIRTAGDASLAGAIVDGMMVSWINPETERIVAQYAISRGREAAYYRRKIRAARKKYTFTPCGRVRAKVLGIWTCVWMLMREAVGRGIA